MKGRQFTLYRFDGKWLLNFVLSPESMQDAKNLVNSQQDRDYEITIKVYREHRSLTANAYFHKLCNLIATRLGVGDDVIKKHLVNTYGAVAETDGGRIEIRIPKGVDPEGYYPYCVWEKSDGVTDTYLLKKQTHAMDSAEFSHLIDCTVEEAKNLGIETLPADELRRMYAQIDKGYCNK